MTGFWHRSLLCVCVYRPRLHLGPSSRKREFNQSSLTIRLFSRAYVTKQKHFGRQDGFLHYYIEVINCIFFIAFVFKNASSDFDFNWSILNNILQNCDLPRLSYTINVLSGLSKAISGNPEQNWLRLRRGFPNQSLVPITPGTGNKC